MIERHPCTDWRWLHEPEELLPVGEIGRPFRSGPSSDPAFSLMIAMGLLISWATPAASLPMEESLCVCSTSRNATSRLSSDSLIRLTMRSVSLKTTRKMAITLGKKQKELALDVYQDRSTSPRGLTTTRT